jgi:hypothetical protein
MPYLDKKTRTRVEPKFEVANFSGELNYQLTTIALAYVKKHGIQYNNLNDVLGAFEGAKLEFYRRIVAPYEALKADQNGDVYEQAFNLPRDAVQ